MNTARRSLAPSYWPEAEFCPEAAPRSLANSQ
jgi:hypothetical protein